MQEFIDKKTLCTRLSISPKVIQKELERAIDGGCDSILKIGKSYRIDFNGFVDYLRNKNKQIRSDKQCQREKLKTLANEAKRTTLTIMTNRGNESASQLKQILGI